MEDNSNFFWSFFLKKKSDLVDVMIGLIKNLKNKYNLQVEYLCCDNIGENVTFKKACKQEGLEIDFKYTVPGMPQQNSCVERKFATLFNQVCAILNDGKLKAYLQNGLWATAAKTVMVLKNNLLTSNRS